MNDLLFSLRGSHKDWRKRLGMVQSCFEHVEKAGLDLQGK